MLDIPIKKGEVYKSTFETDTEVLQKRLRMSAEMK